jgi:two-component system, cell cycle sensor histidine kinase and response regulator CckA
VVHGPDSEVLFCNPMASTLLGLTEEQMRGRTAADPGWRFLREDGAALPLEEYPVNQVLSSGQAVYSVMVGIRYPDRAEPDWVLCNGFPVSDSKGKVLQVVVTFSDITERRRVEKKLRESEELYRSILNASPDGVAITDTEGRILMVSRVARTMFAIEQEEDMIGRPAMDFIAPESRKRAASMIALRFQGAKHGMSEYLGLRADGSTFDLEINSEIIRGEQGQPAQMVTVVRDITERKRVEKALRESEERYRSIVHASPDNITIIDLEGRVLMISPAGLRMWHSEREAEMVGHQVAEFIDPADRDRALSNFALMLQGLKSGPTEYRGLRRDGSALDVEVDGELIRDAEGKPVQTVLIIRDITERKALEARLRQSQKMESVGRLAGGVAHDFNNLLTVINGYATFLSNQLNVRDPLREHAVEIGKAGERAASLTAQLLAFGRKQLIRARALDLNSVVRDAERMLQRLIGEDIELRTRLDPRLGLVMADPDQIHQVIVNLAANARDAMPYGGTLEIATAEVEVDKTDAAGHPDAAPGWHVLLTVTDSGMGMTKEVRQQLFEPFFTTKEQGKGTGLGLATVYGIVRQSNGWTEVRSEVGQGSEFRIYLPRIVAGPPPEDEPVAPRREEDGHETVLVVEDQDAVRRLTTAILKAYGYHVLEAGSGAEACAIAAEAAGEIHLLLTDVVMPGMNGTVLSERLREFRPGLKVVLMSGYSADMIAARGMLPEGVTYLQKPFSPQELALKVREVLSSSPVV